MKDVNPGIVVFLLALLAGCASPPGHIVDPWADHKGAEFRMPACDELLKRDKEANC